MRLTALTSVMTGHQHQRSYLIGDPGTGYITSSTEPRRPGSP
jgi:hypothetical protein